MIAERRILGEWRQIAPDPSPVAIFVTFAADGSLAYRVEAGTTQHVSLTWRIDGEMLVTDQPGAPRESRTRFRFPSESRLVLELNGERFEYERA